MKIDQNKIGRRQKKQAETYKRRLTERMGKDEAEKQALKRVSRSGGRGGGRNSAGEPQKKSSRGARKRTGTQSNASK
jgi:hypothetical protein